MAFDFYSVKSINPFLNGIQVEVQIHGHHPILKGHFPGTPVLPGVCMMYMALLMWNEFHKRAFKVEKIFQMKFIQLVTEPYFDSILFEIQVGLQDKTNLTVSLKKDGILFFSMDAKINEDNA